MPYKLYDIQVNALPACMRSISGRIALLPGSGLAENGHPVTIAPLAARVIEVLRDKYDQAAGRVCGKKYL